MAYDNEGRLTNWQNTPTSPTSTEAMAYDGEGHRVALKANGATTYYLDELEEVSPTGMLTKYFPSACGLNYWGYLSLNNPVFARRWRRHG
jgi:YD repeat-containing protein